MSRKTKVLVGVGVIGVLAVVGGVAFASTRERAIEVRMEEVVRRDLVATVTASGNVRARRSVDISSDVQGRVIELNVREGDEVRAGQVLLRLDPTQFQAAAARAQAGLSQAQAQVAQQRAALTRAEREHNRIAELGRRDPTLVSGQQLQEAETNVEVARALLQASEYGVAQARAALDEARDRLQKTTIRAPISGKVTRRNVEEGETVIVGTMNNPGSLILTISDLSVVEAVVDVDETEVPRISLGDSALVELDAFQGRLFRGKVTEIGNSAIRPPRSVTATAGPAQASTVDFEVVITLDDPPEALRPDLSATADIITATREDALAIPIIALTVRDSPAGDGASREARDTAAAVQAPRGPLGRDLRGAVEEGAYRVQDGRVTFTPVRVGITGQEFFEVLEGLSPGDTVVSGPYQRIRELQDGDAVRPLRDRPSARR